MFRTLTIIIVSLISCTLFSQMPAADGSVRYGNEWIDYSRNYLRVNVAEDGMYRITPAQIAAAGLPATGDWVLHHNGAVVPVQVVSGNLVFYGEKNRGGMDRHLFSDPETMQLNDRYSMHTDTSAYYLSRGSAGAVYSPAVVTGEIVERTSVLRSSELVFNAEMSKSFFRSAGSSIYYSHYDVAEGFGSRSTNDLLSENGSTASTATLPLPGANGAEAVLELRFGTAFDGHTIEISANGNLLKTIEKASWSIQQQRLSFTPAGTSADISVIGTRGNRDKPNLAWIRATYPANTTWDAGLKRFRLPASTTGTRIVLSNLGAGAGAGEVIRSYAPSAGLVVTASISNDGQATLEFPASAQELEWQLLVGSVPAAPVAQPVRFTSVLPTNPATNYLLLTSRRLRGAGIEDLASYRRSAAGGGYTVQVVNVEDLYDEFGYGLGRHPMAIRNYLAAARGVAPGLRYLFLVGKGREYTALRTPDQLAAAQETFFIPSFGFPASDNLLSADLGEVVPYFATGRLAAITPGEVELYAKKLRDVEDQINQGGQTIADRDWMKQVMHLGGGGTPGEQSSIKSRLQLMEDSIRATKMGANVESFFKTSSEPIEDSRQDAIFNRINAGTSIITFFGHSSSQTFDFSIDDPDNYFNFGKYPYMMSLGCYSGDAFTEARSISERFLLLPDKGAIAFAASKGVGYISALGSWGTVIYKSLGNVNYGEGIGDAMRSTIIDFSNTSNFTVGILLEQFSLSGDPAYRLHPRPGADLVIDPATVAFAPEVVPAQNFSYSIKFELVNLGKTAEQDSLTLRFRQELPSGETIDLVTYRVVAPAYRQELKLELPNPGGFAAVGQNRILVTVDSDNEITEAPLPAAENNNELVIGNQPGAPLTFIANTAKTTSPPQYGVVGGPLEFIASTTNALAPEREYIIQVARDRRFNDLLSSETITSPGGVIRYRPDFAPVDSTTYFWRISPDSSTTGGIGYLWSESSFTWVENRTSGTTGWSLQDPGQTIDGTFVNLEADTTNFGWKFTKTNTDYIIFNSIYQNSDMPRLERGGQKIGSPFPWVVRTGMQVYVVDSTNIYDILLNPGGLYNTPNRATKVWCFNTTTAAGRSGMIDFLQNGIEPGKYVFVYSVQRGSSLDYYTEGWEQDSVNNGTNIFNLLEEQGALEVRRIAEVGSVPYIFAYQKNLGALGEVMAEQQSDTVILRTLIKTNWPMGEWQSVYAGPTNKWNSFSAKISSLNYENADSVQVSLLGRGLTGEVTVLQSDEILASDDLTYSADLSVYDAGQYPFMAAKINFFDEDRRSSPTVDFVYFDYDQTGDVAVNPQFAFSMTDSIQQGQDLEFEIGYENISIIPMDSMLVEIRLISQSNEETIIEKRQPPLDAGSLDKIRFTIPSSDFTSDLRLQLTLNPDQDQVERVLFNNLISTKVGINQDIIDPDLKVYFDGDNIIDGALVSARPEILIQLRDENRYLLLNDTSGYQLALLAPSGQRQVISFADSRVEFLPATTGENLAEIFFRPELSENGIYTLIIQGRDRTNNLTGRLNYQKQFEVITSQKVSNVLTYPNPFSTQTQFVYTLTGSEVPEMFRIQIMTVSGQVINDIDLSQLEDIKIGTHRTNYAWDGTDQYGDKLANGVYLYRVITSDSGGNEIEQLENGTAKYFANNLGKVVILR